MHVSTVHEKLKPFSCDLCDLKAHLTSHIRSVHTDENETKIYPCPSCEKDFKTKGQLEIHVNGVHLKLRPHRCDICTETFQYLGGLHQHVESIHL